MTSTYAGMCCADCVAFIENGDMIDGHDRSAVRNELAEYKAMFNAKHAHFSTGGNGGVDFSKSVCCSTCRSTMAGYREQVFVIHDGEE